MPTVADVLPLLSYAGEPDRHSLYSSRGHLTVENIAQQLSTTPEALMAAVGVPLQAADLVWIAGADGSVEQSIDPKPGLTYDTFVEAVKAKGIDLLDGVLPHEE